MLETTTWFCNMIWEPSSTRSSKLEQLHRASYKRFVNSTIPSHASLVFFHLAPLPCHFAAATTTSSAALGMGASTGKVAWHHKKNMKLEIVGILFSIIINRLCLDSLLDLRKTAFVWPTEKSEKKNAIQKKKGTGTPHEILFKFTQGDRVKRFAKGLPSSTFIVISCRLQIPKRGGEDFKPTPKENTCECWMLQKMRWFKMVTSSTFEFWVVNLACIYIYICLYIIYPFIKSQVWGLSWWFVGPGLLTLGFWRVTPIITSSQGTLPKTRKLAWTPKIPMFERKLLFHNPSFLGFMLVFGVVFVCNNSKEDEGRISFVWSFLCLTPLWTSTVLLWPLPCVGRSWSIGYAEVIFHWWVRLSYRTHTF